MAMRLSGLMSGMDTESIVSELVAVKQTKVDNKKKAQTKLSWKQDAWKDLNTKLKNLQSKYINNMRFTTAYAKKTTSVSDSSAVSVITGENAVEGVQSLEISSLAKTAYFTGAAVKGKTEEGATSPTKLTALSKMSDIDGLSLSEESTLKVTIGSDVKSISVKADTTISNILTQLKDAGLNASFDETQQRFFISSKTSGEAQNFSITSENSQLLSGLGLNVTNTVGDAPASAPTVTTGTGTGATYIYGQNAKITLNGAEFSNNTNVFEINGLTFTALSTTEAGKPITVTTKQDTDGIYDMVKNFLKEYNSIINEMDKLYNAESTKGYEPLTDDEKNSMSDDEVEKYEKKIKDSILRRDETVSSVSSALKLAMMSGVEVNGKKMYLSNFGINTLSYFVAADNERNAYHIDGDPDDSNTSGNADRLKSMIASDPDTTISFFTQLTQNVYNKMTELSSISSTRTFGNFYEDKKMKADYNDYTTKIADLEEKLNDYEDKWYKKFSKMETAMAKMQSNASSVTSLLGGG